MPPFATLIVKLKADTRQFNRQMGATRTQLSTFKGSAAATAASVARMTAALAAAGYAAQKLAGRGAAIVGVQKAFARATGDATGALRQLQRATRSMVSDYDLMVGLNRSLALGAATNTREFGELADTAISLGRALGVDAKFALESMSLGIGRQSRLILDNLGLIVSVEEANKKYAAAIGKTVSELSSAQQKEAFRTAALESARAKVEELGGGFDAATDAISQFNTQLKNMRDELAVRTLPVLAEFFGGLAILMGGKPFGEGNLGLASFKFANVDVVTRAIRTQAGLLADAMRRQAAFFKDAQMRHPKAQREFEEEITFHRERLRLLGDTLKAMRQLNQEAASGDGVTELPMLRPTPPTSGALYRAGGPFGALFNMGRAAERFGGTGTYAGPLASIANAIAQSRGQIKEAADVAVVEPISDMSKQLARIGMQIGQQFIFGIIDGINSMESLLKQILKALVSVMLSYVMGPQGLGILSPSRKGIHIGEEFARGIAVGAEMGIPGVAGASGRLATAAVAGAAPAFSMNVDTSGLQRPMNVREAALQSEVIQLFTETARSAHDSGFRWPG